MSYEFTGRRVGFAPSPGFGAVTYGDGGYVPGPFGYSGMGAVTYGRGGLVASQWPALGAVTYGRGGLIPGQWGSMGALGEDSGLLEEAWDKVAIAVGIKDAPSNTTDSTSPSVSTSNAGEPCTIQGGRGYFRASGVCEADSCDPGYEPTPRPDGSTTCSPLAKTGQKPQGSQSGSSGVPRGGASRPSPSAPPPAPPKKPILLSNPLVWVGAAVVVGGVGLVAYKGMKR